MPALDQRYIQKLDDFTKSLEAIVELLKEDSARNNVDNVNRMLSNMTDDISSVVKNMEIVVKSVQKIENQNDKILNEIQEVRKAKETSTFGQISEVDNKRKILDAVKVITLIAGGVLAIGLAFKLISPVDFLSVIAIGLSIVLITGAFVAASALVENLTYRDLFMTSSILLLIASTITISSWILSSAATFTLSKVIGITFTSVALGAALYLMATAIEKSKIQPKDYIKFLLLPLILPLISLSITVSSVILANAETIPIAKMVSVLFIAGTLGGLVFLMKPIMEQLKDIKTENVLSSMFIITALAVGLVGASYILSFTKTLSLAQMFSAIFTAATIGVLVYFMKPIIEKLKEFDYKQVGIAMLMIGALAAGLVIASHILGFMHFFTIKESIQLAITSLAIGLSVLFLVPTVYLLKSIDSKDMLKATGNIVMLSGAIAISSLFLSIGLYDNYPDYQWAFGVGLSLLAFAGTIWIINKMPGLGYKEMLIGMLYLVGISAVITTTSWILSMGNYNKYPSLEWAMGVGLSLIAFGGSMLIIGLFVTMTGGAALGAIAAGAAAVLLLSLTITTISYILGAGKYDKYPTLEWAYGVGLTLTAFGLASIALGFALPLILLGSLSMYVIASSIVKVSNKLASGSYDVAPNEDWAKSVSLLIKSFSDVMIKTALIPNILLSRSAVGLLIIAQNIVDVANKISEGTYDKGPSEDWAKSTSLLISSFSLGSLLLINPFILLGMSAMLYVASSIVEVSKILASGIYTGGPTEEWAKGVGLSIKSFSEGILSLSKSGGFFGRLFGTDQTQMITKIAQAMVDASIILQNGNWESYPKSEWSTGVGNSVLAFAKAIQALDDVDIDVDDEFVKVVRYISIGIIEAAKILNGFDWLNIKNYPQEIWAKSVGTAINAFVKPLTDLANVDITGIYVSRSIKRIAQSMIDAAEKINEVNWAEISNNYPKENWVKGVGEALNIFTKYLVEMEKNDIGQGDLKNLNRTIDSIIRTATKFKIYETLFGNIWQSGPDDNWAKRIGKSLSLFVNYLSQIEKEDLGRGDLKVLNKTIDSILETARNFKLNEILFGDLWKSGPDENWAKRIGSTLDIFVGNLMNIEKSNIGRGDLRNLNRTIESIIRTATEFTVSEMQYPNLWSSGPDDNWSNKIGKSLNIFIEYLSNIEKNNIDQGDIKTINIVVDAMIKTALKLKKAEEDNKNLWKFYPPIEWATSIEKTIGAFSKIIEISSSSEQMLNLDQLSDGLINFTKKIEKVLQNKQLFVKGGLFETFSDSIKKLASSFAESQKIAAGINTLSEALMKISNMGSSTSDSIILLTKSINQLSTSLKEVDIESIDKLSKFSNGMLVLSLIDEDKFESILTLLDKKKNDIVSILSNNETIRTRSYAGQTSIEDNKAKEKESSDKQKFYNQLLNHVSKIDSNINKMAEGKSVLSQKQDNENEEIGGPSNDLFTQQTNPNSRNYQSGKKG